MRSTCATNKRHTRDQPYLCVLKGKKIEGRIRHDVEERRRVAVEGFVVNYKTSKVLPFFGSRWKKLS